MEKMHFKEDTSKPENRTNLALLSIFQINEVRSFFLGKLKLSDKCLIYPSPNLENEEFSTSLRPDFVIKNIEGEEVGYVEVELGPENNSQIKNYEANIKNCKVYSIVGKRNYSPSALSLEELYNYITGIIDKYSLTQKGVSLDLFCMLVKYYVIDGNYKTNISRAGLSKEMYSSILIQKVFSKFGDDTIIKAGGRLIPGKLKIDTISKNGFSLRVFSRKSTSRSLSLMSRSKGCDVIDFPSLKKLKKYIPHREEECARYAKLISNLGDKDILHIDKSQKAHLSLRVVENNFDKFADLIRGLC
jgi:hypothetical protein